MKLFTKRFYRNFKHIKSEFVGKPINYLEIGVFLGYTAEWMIDNVLTHTDARYYGIDPWEWFRPLHRRFPTWEDFKVKMLDNADRMREQYKGKGEFIRGYSQDVLMEPRWKKSSLDLIYIDGHHSMHAVLRDWVLTWPLLKVNGVMIFDDYLQAHNDGVTLACDAILKALGHRDKGNRRRKTKIELLWKNYALGIRKLSE